MKMRTLPKPSVLAAGALEDNGRFLFVKKIAGETEVIELPCAIIPMGANPVSALVEVFHSQLGIDAQVHEVMAENRHNAGTRRFKRLIPVLVFRVTTKNASAKPAPGLGVAWLKLDDAKKMRLSRNSEWLR